MSFSSTSPRPPPLVCTHKNTSRCMLTLPGCCACSDLRPHTPSYYVYVDGMGSVPQGTRWNSYCDHCKVSRLIIKLFTQLIGSAKSGALVSPPHYLVYPTSRAPAPLTAHDHHAERSQAPSRRWRTIPRAVLLVHQPTSGKVIII